MLLEKGFKLTKLAEVSTEFGRVTRGTALLLLLVPIGSALFSNVGVQYAPLALLAQRIARTVHPIGMGFVQIDSAALKNIPHAIGASVGLLLRRRRRRRRRSGRRCCCRRRRGRRRRCLR